MNRREKPLAPPWKVPNFTPAATRPPPVQPIIAGARRADTCSVSTATADLLGAISAHLTHTLEAAVVQDRWGVRVPSSGATHGGTLREVAGMWLLTADADVPHGHPSFARGADDVVALGRVGSTRPQTVAQLVVDRLLRVGHSPVVVRPAPTVTDGDPALSQKVLDGLDPHERLFARLLLAALTHDPHLEVGAGTLPRSAFSVGATRGVVDVTFTDAWVELDWLPQPHTRTPAPAVVAGTRGSVTDTAGKIRHLLGVPGAVAGSPAEPWELWQLGAHLGEVFGLHTSPAPAPVGCLDALRCTPDRTFRDGVLAITDDGWVLLTADGRRHLLWPARMVAKVAVAGEIAAVLTRTAIGRVPDPRPVPAGERLHRYDRDAYRQEVRQWVRRLERVLRRFADLDLAGDPLAGAVDDALRELRRTQRWIAKQQRVPGFAGTAADAADAEAVLGYACGLADAAAWRAENLVAERETLAVPAGGGPAVGAPRPEARLLRTWADAEDAAAAWVEWFGFGPARHAAVGTRDGGVDLEAKGAVVQVKDYASPVPALPVQALQGVAAVEEKAALFFSRAGFTPEAIRYADRAHVALFTFNLQSEVTAVNGPARELMAGGAQPSRTGRHAAGG